MNHRLLALSPDVSPLKVGSLDPGLSGKILDINIHPISFRTILEILQNIVVRVSRGGIDKTFSRAVIYKPGL